MSVSHNLRHAIKSYVPNWLSNRVGFQSAFKILYACALLCDSLIAFGLQGIDAAWPGRGTPTALALIGQGRGLIRGIGESDDSYAARLRAWLTTWRNSGSPEVLAQLIQSYLGGMPVVRVIDRAGNFVTANADGTTTKVSDPTWNWDTVLNPERAGWWSDIWIVIYYSNATWPYYTSFTDPAWDAAWGTYNNFGLGFEITREPVEGISQIVASFKGAHTWVSAVIFTTDVTLFVPGSLGNSGNPDGTWGNWSKPVGIPMVQRRARSIETNGTEHTRYMIPNRGG